MEVLAKTSVCWAMFVTLLGIGQAIFIEGCNSGWLTVQEGSKQPIVCSDFGNPLDVTWSIETSNGSTIFRAFCNMTTCDYNNGISIAAVSGNSSSSLTILKDHRKYGNLRVVCNHGNHLAYVCQIHVESTRNYRDCKFYDDGSTITGHCYMERAYTSNAKFYSCQWSVLYPPALTSWVIPSALVYTAYQESALLYYKGICYFSFPRPTVNVTVMLDGSAISQEHVANVSNATHFPPPPEQNTTVASLPVDYDAVNPLLLMCSGRPEPVQSYEWSGLVCAQGNQKQNVCLVSTSDFTSQQPLVTCTMTSADKNYNGNRITAGFYLQLKNHMLDKTTAASDHTLDKTTTASDHTLDKTTTASDHTLDKTTTASDHTLEKTKTAASDDTHDETTTASDHTLDKTTTASDSTSDSGKHPSTYNDDKSDSMPWRAIGGGVGGAVIIIIIIIVVIVICRRRAGRKKYERPQRRVVDTADPYTGLSAPVVVDSTRMEPYEDFGGYQNQIAIDMSTYDHLHRGEEKDTYTTLVTKTTTKLSQEEGR